MSSPPPVLVLDLVEEVLLRLPPEEPASLVRSSAVCKPWRHILAAPRFRRRYCEFHRTPPVLGIFQMNGRFVRTSYRLPAQPSHIGRVTLDCRHGLVLFTPAILYVEPLDLIVVDPASGHQRRVLSPFNLMARFSAAVLCAAQGCHHHDCQRGHFRVAVVTTDVFEGIRVTSGWLYSSEGHAWTELTPVHHPNGTYVHPPNVNSVRHPNYYYSPLIARGGVLVGDALYFNAMGIIEFQVGMRRLSVFEKPTNDYGTLMTAEGGGLGFAALADVSNLTLWSRQIGPEGSMGSAKIRVVDLKTPLFGLLRLPESFSLLPWGICGFAEGTQAIFVRTSSCSCMVDLKSGLATMVYCDGEKMFPYMRFYLPVMEAACAGQRQ